MRGRSTQPSRGAAITGSVIVVTLLLTPMVHNFTQFAYAGSQRQLRERASVMNLADLYVALETKTPAGSVIASDPLTSFALIAFTDDYVVCTYDQHSTPNDSTALDRILACRDIYLPFTSCQDIAKTLVPYEADYIVVNGRIPTETPSDYWKSDKESATASAQKLLNCPQLFELIYSQDDVYLFKILATSEKVADDASAVSGPPGFVEGPFTGDTSQLTPSGLDGIFIGNCGKDRERVAMGDTLALYVDWILENRVEPGRYSIYVRFDTDFERGFLYNYSYGKIYRKIVERINGERYRFRIDKLPFDGAYPPDKWLRRQRLRQHIDVPIPKDISPGTYTISIKMDNPPHVSNLRMKDLLRDDDLYDGPDLMEVTIE